MLDGTGCARWEQRCEEEVVSGGYDDDVVVFGIEFLEESYRAPSGA